MLTTFLSRAEVVRHLRALHLLRDMREALIQHARGTSSSSLAVETPGPHGATALRHASLASIPAWSLTVRATLRADAKGSGAALHLYDAAGGRLLATMEAGHLSALSQSVVGALAADALARPDASSVALLGAGPSASSVLKALRLVRSLERVTLHDPDLAAATSQSLALYQALSVPVRACDSVAEAIATADLVVLTGRGRLVTGTLCPGAHVTVLGAERLVEPPLPPSVLSTARLFSEVHSPVLRWKAPAVTALAEVLEGRVGARTKPEDVTVFLSTSPPLLDLVAGWHVYEGARDDERLTRIDLDA